MLRTEVLALIDPSDANRKRLELAEKDLFKTLATIKTTSSEACLEMTYGYMQPKGIRSEYCSIVTHRLQRSLNAEWVSYGSLDMWEEYQLDCGKCHTMSAYHKQSKIVYLTLPAVVKWCWKVSKLL